MAPLIKETGILAGPMPEGSERRELDLAELMGRDHREHLERQDQSGIRFEELSALAESGAQSHDIICIAVVGWTRKSE